MTVVETVSPIQNTPHSAILVFCETNVRYYQYKTEAATDHYLQEDNKASYIYIYINLFYTEILVDLIPPQICLRCFHIFQDYKISLLSKILYWDLKITIEDVLFNLYRWWWIIIHHKNPLVKPWQSSSEWCKRLHFLHHQTELKLLQKIFEHPLRNGLMSYRLYFHKSPMVCLFLLSVPVNSCFQDTLISIVRTIHGNYRVVTLILKNMVIYPSVWRIVHYSHYPRFLQILYIYISIKVYNLSRRTIK